MEIIDFVEYKVYVDGEWFMSFQDFKVDSKSQLKEYAIFIAGYYILGGEVENSLAKRMAKVTGLKLSGDVFSFKSKGHKFVVEMG